MSHARNVFGELLNSLHDAAGPLLYLYFTSKEELFSACVDWEMQQMQAALAAATEGITDPFDRIAKAIMAYLTFFDENPDYVELLIQERAIFRGRKRPKYFEYRDANRGP